MNATRTMSYMAKGYFTSVANTCDFLWSLALMTLVIPMSGRFLWWKRTVRAFAVVSSWWRLLDMARSIRNAAEYVYPMRNALYSIIQPSIVSVVIFMGLWQAVVLLINEVQPENKMDVFFHVFYFGWVGDTCWVADPGGPFGGDGPLT